MKLRKLALREINKSLADLMRAFRTGNYHPKNLPERSSSSDESSNAMTDDD
jgi:hypothetical protein